MMELIVADCSILLKNKSKVDFFYVTIVEQHSYITEKQTTVLKSVVHCLPRRYLIRDDFMMHPNINTILFGGSEQHRLNMD